MKGKEKALIKIQANYIHEKANYFAYNPFVCSNHQAARNRNNWILCQGWIDRICLGQGNIKNSSYFYFKAVRIIGLSLTNKVCSDCATGFSETSLKGW